jgi:hypothetical protein
VQRRVFALQVTNGQIDKQAIVLTRELTVYSCHNSNLLVNVIDKDLQIRYAWERVSIPPSGPVQFLELPFGTFMSYGDLLLRHQEITGIGPLGT